MTTGALAVISAQPTDVVKVRMQADCPLPGQPRRYAGSNIAYRTIASQEGENIPVYFVILALNASLKVMINGR